MANIALLNRCNLKCPYCFANDYTESKGDDINVDTFLELLDFVAPDREVGLIGGEPLLHEKIDTFLEILDNDYRFRAVTLFTNGIYIDKHIDYLKSPNLIILINVNSKEQIGKLFDKVDNGIELLINQGMKNSITLGINIYKENQDFSDILYLAKKYGIKKIRVSVVIPQDKSEGGINYFYRMKNTLLSLCRELKEIGACPYYDCNAVPECIYTDEETEFISSLPFNSEYEREIFMGKRSVCSPVIDIYPDKTATRCFGCYDNKVKIEDFKSILDIRNYFFMQIDSRLVHNYSRKECKDCYKHKTFGCFGGCLCYKKNDI
jgi:MoaA/NifB/PqqE/SkfB family radical SAM enzyme